MAPRLRKVLLASHVSVSVGWIGTIVAFLILAVAGLNSSSTQTIRACYVSMGLITWCGVAPLAFASVATGVASSLGTAWGFFRHYWVLIKLLVTLLATAVLMLHMQPIDLLAAAANAGLPGPDLHQARVLMVSASSAAIIALLVLTVMSVYKPQGLTPYGWRKQFATPARV